VRPWVRGALAAMSGVVAACGAGLPRVVRAQSPAVDSTLHVLTNDTSTVDTRLNALRHVFSLPHQGQGVRGLIASYPADSDRIITALIRALQQQVPRKSKEESSGEGEALGEYQSELVSMLAQVHDQRALPALIGVIETGGIAERGVAQFGAAAVPPLAHAFDSPNGGARQGVVHALGMIAQQRDAAGVDSAAMSTIRRVLLRAVSDSDRFLRYAALEGLANVPGAEATAALRKAAASDPWPGNRNRAKALLRTRTVGG
jgi:HEAT repeat protein